MSILSLSCDNKGQLYEAKTIPNPYKNKKNYINSISQQFKMFKFINRVKTNKDENLNINDYLNNLEKYNSNYNYRVDESILIEHNFTSKKKEFLSNLIEEQTNQKENYLFLLDFLDKKSKSDSKLNSQEKDINNFKTEKKDSKNFSMNKNPLIKISGENKVFIFPSVLK